MVRRPRIVSTREGDWGKEKLQRAKRWGEEDEDEKMPKKVDAWARDKEMHEGTPVGARGTWWH